MSATRDKTQKITFVYSNLYSVYRKGVERAREGATAESGTESPSRAAEALTELATAKSFESGVVIKASDSRAQVSTYTPAELIGKRVARPAVLPAQARAQAPAQAQAQATPQAVASLKDNLKSLNDLQARLRFMLEELEGLIKE
jgi:hypothetical protein